MSLIVPAATGSNLSKIDETIGLQSAWSTLIQEFGWVFR